MYRYKRILVSVNLDEQDELLIRQASVIAGMANAEKLYFLYADKQMDVPDEVLKAYPQLTESVADFARERIIEAVNKVFKKDTRPEITIIVQEGLLLDEILKQVRLNGIDLVLFGLSKHQSHSGNMATKLARKAPCSVLVIPEGAELNLHNPAVAVDFSEYSADAMDAALAFTRAGKVPGLTMLHVYQVPTGYYKTGKSFEEFAGIMKTHAQNRFAEFMSSLNSEGTEIQAQYILDKDASEAIRRAVKDLGISFLVVGARGRSAGAAVMLGSVSEKLIESLGIPMLAVKKKGSGLSILDAILK